MESQLKGRVRAFSDQQLRSDLEAGIKPAEIARKYEVTSAAVSQRIKKLNLTTVTAAVAPAESERYVSNKNDAISQLGLGLSRVNLLMDACDEWLRDPQRPERYDIGPRADDVEVIYTVTITTANGPQKQKRKKTLAELLGDVEDGCDDDGARFEQVEKGEYKTADPRELILKTVQESRQTVGAMTELAKLLADMKAMQEWRETVLDAIGKVAPDVREQIIGEIRSSLVLRGLLDGPAGNGHGLH